MAGGYTPAFASLYTGTLYGKWPAAAVWASLLPLIDSRGHIEMTYEAISGMTGWPLDLLRAGINELLKPDPGSRSGAEGGRRLVPLDPARSWGWRAVNVQKYREKASGRIQVDDGRNAEKVRRYKAKKKTPADTGGHRLTPPNTNSDSNTYSDSERGRGPLTSSPRKHVSGSSPTLKAQDDLKSRSGEESRKAAAIAASVRQLAQAKRPPR